MHTDMCTHNTETVKGAPNETSGPSFRPALLDLEAKEPFKADQIVLEPDSHKTKKMFNDASHHVVLKNAVYLQWRDGRRVNQKRHLDR